MKKTILFFLIFLSLAVLTFRYRNLALNFFFGYVEKAGIKVTSIPQSTVFLNGVEVGQTPWENNNLKVAPYELRLVSKTSIWQGQVKLSSGTLSVVNRELGETIAASSGEMLTLSPGSGVMITSIPSGSTVEIDGTEVGQTPLVVPTLSAGEHTFLLSHEGYLKRSIQALLPPIMQLNLAVDLAIAEMDFGLSPSVVPEIPTVQNVIVKSTPNGFLRVREKPSTAGREIGKVSSGDSLVLLEELSGWVKVRLDDGTEGYVSSAYIQKSS